MLKHIAKSLGLMTHYNETIMLQLVLKEIERLQEVEQACTWDRTIANNPEHNRREILESYASWTTKPFSLYREDDEHI